MSLLLGGLITLAVTAVVQILIIPWVQRRNRIRERWEKDVLELLTLLDEELGEPVSRVRYEIQRLSDARPGPAEEVEKLRGDAIRAWEVLDALTTRMTNLTFRVIRVNRTAPDWSHLVGDTVEISRAAAQLNPRPWGRGFDTDREAARAALSAINDHSSNAARLLQDVGVSMSPPRTYPMRRLVTRMRARPRRIRSRG